MSLVSDRPVILSVPFDSKDRAKKAGAKPYYENRRFVHWYVPEGADLTPFAEWLPATWASKLKVEQGEVEEGQRVSVSLSQLLAGVKNAIETAGLGGMWVMAEISEFKTNRHAYLDLVEYNSQGKKVAQVRALIWERQFEEVLANFVRVVGSNPVSGMKILAKVNPRFNESYGLSLDVLEIDPSCTVGDMERKIREITESLKKEGIYDQNRSLERPRDFFRLAVISPSQAAGLGDFMTKSNVLQDAGVCEFNYFTATFQGADAERSILQALQQTSMLDDLDGIILIRGGGAKAGLYELNNEKLARAICTLPVPVITGIGHEQDNTILDDVACMRCATPSMVIAHVMDSVVGNARSIKDARQNLQIGAQRLIARARDQIAANREQLYRVAQEQTSKAREQLNDLNRSLVFGAQSQCQEARSQLTQLMQALVYQDPSKIIARGYAVVRQDGKVVGSAGKMETKHPISIQLRDGVVNATVDSKEIASE